MSIMDTTPRLNLFKINNNGVVSGVFIVDFEVLQHNHVCNEDLDRIYCSLSLPLIGNIQKLFAVPRKIRRLKSVAFFNPCAKTENIFSKMHKIIKFIVKSITSVSKEVLAASLVYFSKTEDI